MSSAGAAVAAPKEAAAPAPPSALHETLYFALRNRKLVIGIVVLSLMLLLALLGPLFARHDPLEYGGRQRFALDRGGPGQPFGSFEHTLVVRRAT